MAHPHGDRDDDQANGQQREAGSHQTEVPGPDQEQDERQEQAEEPGR
jgi:hypothetical protein